ncbi:hypothetical protein ACOMHN_043820 [Nucella lapillus]
MFCSVLSQEAYKHWLCASTLPFYLEGHTVRPCSTFCQQVEAMCPFFRPKVDTHEGDPSFICKDQIGVQQKVSSDIPEEPGLSARQRQDIGHILPEQFTRYAEPPAKKVRDIIFEYFIVLTLISKQTNKTMLVSGSRVPPGLVYESTRGDAAATAPTYDPTLLA